MRKRRFLTLGGLLALSRRQQSRLTLDEILRYGKYFSHLRLRDKLHEVARIAGEQLLLPVLRLWYVLRADSTPPARKAYLVGALGYFILPLDLIPDVLGLIGFSDDLAVVMLLSKWVDDLMTPEIERRAEEAYHRLCPLRH